MARKRRAPSPPPPQQSSSSDESEEQEEEEEEEGSPRAAATQMRPQNPQPHPSAAAAYDAEEEFDSDVDARAFQMRPLSHSPSKRTAAASQVESEANEEEDSESSEPNPEVPEPVPKKAATRESNTVEDKKRPAPEPAPSGRAKKTKAEASPAAKGKKANAETEKAAPEPILPSGKTKKPAPFHRVWSKEDSIKILEALAAHVKSESALPKTEVLIAAVRDHLDRKDVNYTNMYEKVRRLREMYEKTVNTGNLPSEEDELQMFNLSETIWGEKAKEAIAAAASRTDSTVTKSKKGKANKEKVDGTSKGGTVKEVAYQNSDTQKGSKKGLQVETDRNIKSRLSMKTAATDTQDGDVLTKRDGRKMHKEASNGNDNDGAGTDEESHEEDTERGASVQGTFRSFDELQNLYPSLAWCVERIKAQHPRGETLGRAFGFIGDEKANSLESKIKSLRISEAKDQIRQGDIKKELLNMLIGLAD